jgi:hypothetical protein
MIKILNYSKKSISARIILSLCLTAVILASLVLVNVQTVSAYEITMLNVPETMCKCDATMLTGVVTIEGGEYESITGMQLVIDGAGGSRMTTFGPEGDVSGRNGHDVVSVNPFRISNYAYGGFGYQTDGYGYSGGRTGQGLAPLALQYQIVVSMCDMPAGEYTVQFSATIKGHVYTSPEYHITVTDCRATAAP